VGGDDRLVTVDELGGQDNRTDRTGPDESTREEGRAARRVDRGEENVDEERDDDGMGEEEDKEAEGERKKEKRWGSTIRERDRNNNTTLSSSLAVLHSTAYPALWSNRAAE
jgi:hypothetical protein